MSVSEDRVPRILKVIAATTAIVGTLDIADAFFFYGLRGVSPARVLQSIAATALLGRSAYAGGNRTAVLGLAVHFGIACVVTTVYLLASLKLPLFRHPLLFGALYGLAVYGVMNFIVLPLSRTPPKVLIQPFAPLLNGVAALVVCIGMPIALSATRFLPHPGSAA